MFEGTGQWSLVFPRFIADPELGIHFGRARGPMLQSARLGLVLIVCAAATVGLVLQAGVWKRLAILGSLLLTPLYGAALYFTYTRSVWIGAAMAVFVGLWLALRRQGRVALFATAACALVLVVVAKGERLVAFERESSASVTRESTYMRASFAYVSWRMFLDQPFTGVGFGQYKEKSQPYLSDRTTWLQLEQIRGYIHHNTLLSLLVELGVSGPLLFVTLLACWCRQCHRRVARLVAAHLDAAAGNAVSGRRRAVRAAAPVSRSHLFTDRELGAVFSRRHDVGSEGNAARGPRTGAIRNTRKRRALAQPVCRSSGPAFLAGNL